VKVLERKNAPLDLSVLTPPTAQLHGRIVALFSQLCAQDSWGSARDVKTLAKTIFNTLLSTAISPVTNLILSEAIILDTMKSMLDERERRSAAVGTSRSRNSLPRDLPAPSQQQQQQPRPSEALAPEIATEAKPQTPQAPPPVEAHPERKDQEQRPDATKNTDTTAGAEDPIDFIFKAKRDPGVSDAVWEQLQRDKHAMLASEREFRRLCEEKRHEEQRIEELKRAEQAAKDDEERRIHEKERTAAELERRRKEAELKATEEEREVEQRRQSELRAMGPCPMGYSWIKQGGGYSLTGLMMRWLTSTASDCSKRLVTLLHEHC
jgi:hypothetical protein